MLPLLAAVLCKKIGRSQAKKLIGVCSLTPILWSYEWPALAVSLGCTQEHTVCSDWAASLMTIYKGSASA